MIPIEDPELVLVCDFKKFVLKGRKGKQLLHVSKPIVNKNINITNDINLDYYQRLLACGYTKSYAAILALLLRGKVKGINLRGKHVRVFFEDKSHIKIDLNSPELLDNQLDLVKTIVQTYKSEREKSIMKILNKEKGSITFTPNLRDNRSFYHEYQDNICCEMMCNEEEEKHYIKSPTGDYYVEPRAIEYHVGEEELLEYTLKQFVKNTNKEIQIKKIAMNTNQILNYSNIALENLAYMPIGVISFSKDDQNILLDCLPTSMAKKALSIVEDHNDRIKNNKNKEYKKEMNNHGTN